MRIVGIDVDWVTSGGGAVGCAEGGGREASIGISSGSGGDGVSTGIGERHPDPVRKDPCSGEVLSGGVWLGVAEAGVVWRLWVC